MFICCFNLDFSKQTEWGQLDSVLCLRRLRWLVRGQRGLMDKWQSVRPSPVDLILFAWRCCPSCTHAKTLLYWHVIEQHQMWKKSYRVVHDNRVSYTERPCAIAEVVFNPQWVVLLLFSFKLLSCCNPLCYHPLQTEDELELVNEVISPHVSHSHESMAVDCSHTLLAWSRTVQESIVCSGLVLTDIFLGWSSVCGPH